MLNDKLKKGTVKGDIELFWVTGDKWESFHKQSNIVVNNAADIMAAAVSGERVVDCIYLAFENDPGAVNYTESVQNDAAYYATASNNRSFVRITTLSVPTITSTDPDFSGNRVIFMGVSDGVSFFPGTPVLDETSVFYHSALVSTKEGEEQSDDMIFSCADFSTPVKKVAGAQLGMRWGLSFTN